MTDEHGLPVRLAITPGQHHDATVAAALLDDLKAGQMLLADKAYDADWIRALVYDKGAWANIPPRSNRKDPVCFSPHLYKARNVIERFFNRLKYLSRVATRYDKLGSTFLAMVKFPATRL